MVWEYVFLMYHDIRGGGSEIQWYLTLLYNDDQYYSQQFVIMITFLHLGLSGKGPAENEGGQSSGDKDAGNQTNPGKSDLSTFENVSFIWFHKEALMFRTSCRIKFLP